MRNHDFTLRQLQYAVAVADAEGFRAAAEVCGVSQPSLSAQIARLEQALGLALFERHARRTLVTPEGRDLVETMRELLRVADRVEQQARALLDPWSVPLSVGVIPTVAPYLLPRIVGRLDDERGAPRVHWLELQTRECNEGLADGSLDAIVIADPPELPSTDTVEIGWEPFYVVARRGTLPEGPVHVEQLDVSELILLDEGHCLREHTLALCHLSASTTSPYRGTSLPTVVQMVAAGLGVTVVPAISLAREADGRALDARPFEPPIGRTLRLIWRSRNPRSAQIGQLADCLRGALVAALEGVTSDRR